MSASKEGAEFTTVGVDPDLHSDLCEIRDGYGFQSHRSLIRAMEKQFDPEQR